MTQEEFDNIRIEDGDEYTVQEIAEIFGLRPVRIRQIIERALMRLRHSSRSKVLAGMEDGISSTRQATGRIRPRQTLEQLEEWVPFYWPEVI